MDFYWTFFWAWIGIGVVAFLASMFVKAPYGRHTRGGWGPSIPNQLGWFLMEIPTLIFFNYFFLTGPVEKTTVHWVLAAFYNLHYFYRGVIFPFRLRTKGKSMPMSIALMAILFNLANGYVLGTWFGTYGEYDNSWLTSAPFLIGTAVFFVGMGINWWADDALIKLRKPGEKGYKIPRGGLFEKVSCPNHFGEMLEWTGYAILAWALPVAGFAIWTVLNVLPRSLAHHRWYQEKFEDYPAQRKAVWPGIL